MESEFEKTNPSAGRTTSTFGPDPLGDSHGLTTSTTPPAHVTPLDFAHIVLHAVRPHPGAYHAIREALREFWPLEVLDQPAPAWITSAIKPTQTRS